VKRMDWRLNSAAECAGEQKHTKITHFWSIGVLVRKKFVLISFTSLSWYRIRF